MLFDLRSLTKFPPLIAQVDWIVRNFSPPAGTESDNGLSAILLLQIFHNRVENAVDECSGIAVTVHFRQFNQFIDRNPGGDIRSIPDLIHSNPQQIAVHRCQSA